MVALGASMGEKFRDIGHSVASDMCVCDVLQEDRDMWMDWEICTLTTQSLTAMIRPKSVSETRERRVEGCKEIVQAVTDHQTHLMGDESRR